MKRLCQLEQERDGEDRPLHNDEVGEARPDLQPGPGVRHLREEDQPETVSAQLEHPADGSDVQVAQGEQLDEGDRDNEEGEEDLHQEQAAHQEGVEDGHKGTDGGGVEAVEAGDVARGEEGVEDEEDKGEDTANVVAVQCLSLVTLHLLVHVDVEVEVVGKLLFLLLNLSLFFGKPGFKSRDKDWKKKRFI